MSFPPRIIKRREMNKCEECGDECAGVVCETCCEHEYDADEGFMCVHCNKEGIEDVMCRAFDRAKDLMKYGE